MRIPPPRRTGLTWLVLGASLFAVAACSPARVRVQEATGQPGKDGPAQDATASPAAQPAGAQALLDEINRRRAEGATCGTERKAPAPPMRWNALLQRAAEQHVNDMATQRGGSDIGHAGSDGSTVGHRVESAGYRWSAVGENVAAGRATASATLAQWMASPGHCSNILDPRFVDVAVAAAHRPTTNLKHYWVMVLGRP